MTSRPRIGPPLFFVITCFPYCNGFRTYTRIILQDDSEDAMKTKTMVLRALSVLAAACLVDWWSGSFRGVRPAGAPVAKNDDRTRRTHAACRAYLVFLP